MLFGTVLSDWLRRTFLRPMRCLSIYVHSVSRSLAFTSCCFIGSLNSVWVWLLFTWLYVCLLVCLTVRDLLSSSERLGVTLPETIALQHLVESVDRWTERAMAALANDSIARIHELISLHQQKPPNAEHSMPTDQFDPLVSIRTSPDFGIIIYWHSLNFLWCFDLTAGRASSL